MTDAMNLDEHYFVQIKNLFAKTDNQKEHKYGDNFIRKLRHIMPRGEVYQRLIMIDNYYIIIRENTT